MFDRSIRERPSLAEPDPLEFQFPRPLATVVTLVAVFFTFDDLVRLTTSIGDARSGVEAIRIVLCAVAMATAYWFPYVGGVLSWAAFAASLASGTIGIMPLVLLVVAVAVTATTNRVFSVVNVVVLVAGIIASAFRWPGTVDFVFWTSAALLAVGVALGTIVRWILRSRVEQLRQRELLDQVRRQAEHARRAERERVAHDMHDYVAHELTLIVATLAAARAKREALSPPAPATSSTPSERTARTADESTGAGGSTGGSGESASPGEADSDRPLQLLVMVEQSSRKALDELRGVLRLLGDEPGERQGQVGDGEYGDTAAAWTRSGLSPRVLQPDDLDRRITSMVQEAAQDFEAIGNRVDIRLDPSLDHATVTDGHAELVRRFLTEGVTNIVKHGGINAHVVMEVESVPDTDRIRISLCNSMGRTEAVSPRDSTGLGVAGLRRDAASNNCSVEAGPIRKGDLRWALTLEVPRDSVPAPPPDPGGGTTRFEPGHNG